LIYECVNKIEIKNLKGIQFSKLADNFFLLQVDGVTPFCENRKKTEILALLLKLKPELNVLFNNDFNVIYDAKKPKPTLFQFVSVPGMPPNGQFLPKKHRCNVSPDQGQSVYPNLKEPEKVSHSYSSSISSSNSSTPMSAPAPPTSARPFGGGGGASAPPTFGGGGAPPPIPAASPREPQSGYGGNNNSGGYGGAPSPVSARDPPVGGGAPPFGGRGPPAFGRGPPPIGGNTPTPSPSPVPRPQPTPGGAPPGGMPMGMGIPPGGRPLPTAGAGGGGGEVPEWKRKLMERQNTNQ